jgi:nucleoside-diphosphate-sugar epimerase
MPHLLPDVPEVTNHQSADRQTSCKAVFVTGGSGFVGLHVLSELLALGRPLFVLDRSGSLATSSAGKGMTIIKGDLLESDTYRAALHSCEVVVHLAAITGAATRAEHERVNAQGTEALLKACRSESVSKILFVSSNAATFPPNTGYHYADAKRRAEDAVRRSGLKFTIVRPTVIAGPGSPNLKSLEKLALLPFVVVPGSGQARVQPIDVGDVAKTIAGIVARDAFANSVIELGGPKVLSMEEHLQQIRVARTGRTGRVVRVPLPVFSVPLRMAEAVGLGPLLPVTAGQLSSFRFDGVTQEHRSQVTDESLANECGVFTRYLLTRDPDSYIVSHYAAASSARPLAPTSTFDRALLAFARMGPLSARLADSYASAFVRNAVLRKRLVLLLALLETRGPFHRDIDRAVPGSLPFLLARLSITTFAALVTLLVGSLILAPAHAVLAIAGRASK